VLWRWVSERSIGAELDEARMFEGASFREERVGTNGIGTALESRQLAEVIGADHFVEAFHPWACVAAPVMHPITRRIVGAVNVTCFETDANQFLRAMTRSLADNVGGRLVESAAPSERALLDAFVVGRRRTTAPVVVLNDRMMIADDAAGTWGLEHHVLWERVRDADAEADLVLLDGLRARVHPLKDVAAVLLTLHPDPTVASAPTIGGPALTVLESVEADAIARALTDCGGNKSLAAARLGISRGTLYTKLRHYRIGTPGPSPFV